MNVYLNGFDTKEVSLIAGMGVKEGKAVNFLTKTTVGSAAVDTNICGVCTLIRNGMASVVIRGHVNVPYSGSAPSLGYNKLTSDGAGGVKVNENGRDILVVDVDPMKKICGIVL